MIRCLLIAAAASGGVLIAATAVCARESDSLTVDFPTARHITQTVNEISDDTDTTDIDISLAGAGPIPYSLPKSGYVVIYEPDGTTISDFLVSFTGSSLQLYSDGGPDFPTIATLQAAGLKQLGSLDEDKRGIVASMGVYFGVRSGRIVLRSDGDVAAGRAPEPGTWALMLVGVGGLGAAARRRRAALVAGGRIELPT